MRPLYKSYKPNPIVPFPLTQECIQQLESALLLPTSCQFFYEFISDWGDIQGITLMALYSDLRIYNSLVADKASQTQLEEQAK